MFLSAGISAFLAIPALALSGYFGALFSLRKGDHYGPLNDVFFALAVFLLILPAIAVNDLANQQVGVWFDTVTWAAVAGMVVADVGQTLLVVRAISLQASFTTGGLGILPVLAWMASMAVVSLRNAVPDEPVGWAMTVSLALMIPTALLPAMSVKMSLRLSVAGVLGLALVAWLLALGIDLLDHA